jgi:hypothetical protein
MGGCVDVYLRCGALSQDSDAKTVEAVQAFLMHPSIRPPAIDIQVREANPCQLTVRLTLTAEISETARAGVTAALSKVVGSAGISDTLYASTLHRVVTQCLPHDVNVHDLQVRGMLQYPGTTPIEIVGTQTFTTIDVPGDAFVDTVALYLHPEDVVIHVSKE